MRRAALAVVWLLALAAGCHRSRYPEGRHEIVRRRLPETFPYEVLEQADRLQLVAIDESGVSPEHLNVSSGYAIRAAVDVTSAADRERVVRTIYRAIRDAGGYFTCFSAHHAIRAWRKGVVIEFVISSCGLMAVTGTQAEIPIKTSEFVDLLDGVFEARGLSLGPVKGLSGEGWIDKGPARSVRSADGGV